MKTKFDHIKRLRPGTQRRIDAAVKEQNRLDRERRKKEREDERKRYMERFKPCPFCPPPGKNLVVNINGLQTDWVRCDDCNCTGPCADGEEDAIKKWNQRRRR